MKKSLEARARGANIHFIFAIEHHRQALYWPQLKWNFWCSHVMHTGLNIGLIEIGKLNKHFNICLFIACFYVRLRTNLHTRTRGRRTNHWPSYKKIRSYTLLLITTVTQFSRFMCLLPWTYMMLALAQWSLRYRSNSRTQFWSFQIFRSLRTHCMCLMTSRSWTNASKPVSVCPWVAMAVVERQSCSTFDRGAVFAPRWRKDPAATVVWINSQWQISVSRTADATQDTHATLCV